MQHPKSTRTARRLTELVRIEEDTGTTADAHGNAVERWRPIGELPAAVEPLTAREYLQAQQAQADVQYRVEMRTGGAADRLTGRHRLVWLSRGNRVLYLEPPLIDARKQWLTALAKERV